MRSDNKCLLERENKSIVLNVVYATVIFYIKSMLQRNDVKKISAPNTSKPSGFRFI